MNKLRHHRVMKLLVVFVLFGGASCVWAQAVKVASVEGSFDLQHTFGTAPRTVVGTILNTDDVIITGSDGTVKLTENGVNQITVHPNSVFMLQKRNQDSKPKTVFTTVLGSVSYKLVQSSEAAEPDFATMSCTAASRGATFTVFAGSDGSSLFVVSEGKVTVQAEGSSVELTPDEAVQTEPGSPPGTQFKVVGGKVDFSQWNAKQDAKIAKDPTGALASVGESLASILSPLKRIVPFYNESKKKLKAGRLAIEVLQDAGKYSHASQYYKVTVQPLELKTNDMHVNIRYWTLSALSLRKYVMGHIFLVTTLKEVHNLSSASYLSFLREFKRLDKDFEEIAGPHLVPNDM